MASVLLNNATFPAQAFVTNDLQVQGNENLNGNLVVGGNITSNVGTVKAPIFVSAVAQRSLLITNASGGMTTQNISPTIYITTPGVYLCQATFTTNDPGAATPYANHFNTNGFPTNSSSAIVEYAYQYANPSDHSDFVVFNKYVSNLVHSNLSTANLTNFPLAFYDGTPNSSPAVNASVGINVSGDTNNGQNVPTPPGVTITCTLSVTRLSYAPNWGPATYPATASV